MKKTDSIPFDAQMLAVLHRAGGRWIALVARTNGTRPHLQATRTFSDAEIHRLDTWLDDQHVGQVLVVLPGSTVVCRTCTLPKSDPVQLDQALELQAEAHIASLAPPHRTAAAVLHAAPEEMTRCGIMIAWPEAAHYDLPDTNRPIRLTSDIVALASLLNGQRPTNPLVWLDRDNGALALALTHTNGAVFRCTCEDAESSEAWQRNVGRALTETGLSVGHTDHFIEDLVRDTQRNIAQLNGTPAGLFMPEEIVHSASNRLSGAESGSDWWRQYGIATGALLARCDQLQPLTELQATPPIERPSLIRTAFESMSRPRMATTLAVLCVLLLLFGPMAVHGLRLAVLTMRFQDIQSQLDAVEELEKKRDMYDALTELSWPMTKLLADLATNTPESIVLVSIRVTDDTVSVNGVAKPFNEDGQNLTGTEVIAQMQKNLEDSYIFTGTTLNWDEPNNLNQSYEFSLSTKIARPYRIVQYDLERDFAKYTMQMRVDNVKPGEAVGDPGAGVEPTRDERLAATPTTDNTVHNLIDEPTPENVLAASDPDATTTPIRSGRRSSGGNTGSSGTSRDANRGGADIGIPPSKNIPEPLSPEQIAAMSETEARTMLSEVATARRYVDLDEATALRLKEEFSQLLAHITSLKKKD